MVHLLDHTYAGWQHLDTCLSPGLWEALHSDQLTVATLLFTRSIGWSPLFAGPPRYAVRCPPVSTSVVAYRKALAAFARGLRGPGRPIFSCAAQPEISGTHYANGDSGKL